MQNVLLPIGAGILGLVGLVAGGAALWADKAGDLINSVPEPLQGILLLAYWIVGVFASSIECQLTGQHCGI